MRGPTFQSLLCSSEDNSSCTVLTEVYLRARACVVQGAVAIEVTRSKTVGQGGIFGKGGESGGGGGEDRFQGDGAACAAAFRVLKVGLG